MQVTWTETETPPPSKFLSSAYSVLELPLLLLTAAGCWPMMDFVINEVKYEWILSQLRWVCCSSWGFLLFLLLMLFLYSIQMR